jgi:hypothetical protein
VSGWVTLVKINYYNDIDLMMILPPSLLLLHLMPWLLVCVRTEAPLALASVTPPCHSHDPLPQCQLVEPHLSSSPIVLTLGSHHSRQLLEQLSHVLTSR